MIGLIILLALAVLGTAWLTAAGTAVRSVSRLWLRHWAEDRLAGHPIAARYVSHPQRLLIASRAGVAMLVTLCGVLLGAAHLGSAWRFVGAYIVLALVLLLVGQLIPRAIARRWAPQLVPVVLPPLELAAVVVNPLVRGLHAVTRAVRHRAGHIEIREARDGVEDLLREGELEGIGEPDENRIITGVMEFGDKVLRDVMTPRPDVVAIDADTPPAAAARLIARSGFSRLPVYRGSRDHIVGMVHALDLFKTGAESFPPIREVAQAPATMSCGEMLFRMLRSQRHLAVVLGDDGTVAGIVTLEDVLDELVGGIGPEEEDDDPSDAREASDDRDAALVRPR
ncbi:MAG TPA: CBS domain-containing protein [Gemmatimonadaceae bacterium]|nr:CBS domain-containing protein [Gemmatimonadaceae bacterium]